MLWPSLFPEIATFAMGCPNPLLEAKLRQAAIEFLERTRAWVEWLDPATSYEGVLEYDFDLPAGTDVVRVERATLDGEPIEIVSYRDADHDWLRQPMLEQGVLSRDLKTFCLGVSVASGALIQIQAALKPSRNATGIPDDLADKYRDDIVHGARYLVLSMPGTPFYKPDTAAVERALFEGAIASRSVQAWRGHTANTPRARVKLC